MAYVVQTVAAITDIPAAVASIAIAQGWTVNTSTPTQPIFTLPTSPASINWRLSAAISAQDHTLTWTANGSAVPTSTANIRSPKLAPSSGTTAAVPPPAKIHVFISPYTGSPIVAPYLSIVVEYNSNLFRHLYLGVMEKKGNYTGGEVIAGTAGPISASSSTHSFDDYATTQGLFSGRSSIWGTTGCGGVNINHADNPNQWRKFLGHSSLTKTNFPADAVMGGFMDGINDGYLANGQMNFAGTSALTPINLYAIKPVTGDVNFVPIGNPPGVRLVNMQNFDPGVQVSIGGVNWRVFPQAAKRVEQTMPPASSNGNWRQYETSYYVGYAYREN